MSESLDHVDAELPAPSAPAARPGVGGTVLRMALALALGLALGALGTATHRTLWHGLPLGLAIALALTASTGVLCRAWAGLGTLAAAGVGWIAAVQVLSLQGQGGDVLVTDPGASLPVAWAGIVWTYGGVALLGAVAFLPRRWFARR
ncbi:hypothetical protein ET495_00460 [Xylanimonas allomyrinae]|uniref:Uncharacterized protein n=1 Tax=Xylanimonas allomyrinae TaxID=2509459 RepID=A0A4P6EVF4_9MICO|nr:hypothetical protein [Xylanimonas allomyrinae]QAY62018.1 hypothetical protein ET495_00460 [Xylanimonas allomyrinae]